MIVAMDFHQSPLSLALLDKSGIEQAECTWRKESAEREAAARLAQLLAEHHVSVTDISGILLNIGPGSYTGLRLAASLALGLCYALSVPLLTYRGPDRPTPESWQPTTPTKLRLNYGGVPTITAPKLQR